MKFMAKKATRAVRAVKALPKFENGSYVRDVVTKLEGVIVATTIWLNGCIRYVVQPPEIKDGKPVDNTCIDEQQLELLEVADPEVAEKLTGGNRDDSKAISR